MGLLGNIFGNKNVIIQDVTGNTVVQIDASIKEIHSRESPLSQFPIEDGNDVSDHVFLKPAGLELFAMISDTPIGGLQGLIQEAATSGAQNLFPQSKLAASAAIGAVAGAAALYNASQGKTKSIKAYEQLKTFQANSAILSVRTTLDKYTSMIIVSMSVPREAATGNAIEFTIKMMKANIVQPQSLNLSQLNNPLVSTNVAEVGQQQTQAASPFSQGRVTAISDAGGIAK